MAEPPAWADCLERSKLPPLTEENQAWIEDVAHNVAGGLQIFSCAVLSARTMSIDPVSEDLLGLPGFVLCEPPRLCSPGFDRRRLTADDACAPLVAGPSKAPRTMPVGWTRRFLNIERDMRPGCATPDAAVVHFYASLMREDDEHLAALPPRNEWDDVLTRKMDKHARFSFHAVRLQGLRCEGERCMFEVFMNVSRRGRPPRSEGDKDQGTLRRRDEHRWVVDRPPT